MVCFGVREQGRVSSPSPTESGREYGVRKRRPAPEAAGHGGAFYSVILNLNHGVGAAGVALRAESANLRRRRVGHINGKFLDVFLRRVPGNGVEYTGDLQSCDICALGKCSQQTHPKQAKNDVVTLPLQPVTIDVLGELPPVALGGFKFVGKTVDQLIR